MVCVIQFNIEMQKRIWRKWIKSVCNQQFSCWNQRSTTGTAYYQINCTNKIKFSIFSVRFSVCMSFNMKNQHKIIFKQFDLCQSHQFKYNVIHKINAIYLTIWAVGWTKTAWFKIANDHVALAIRNVVNE